MNGETLEIYRNKANWVAGWLMAVGMLVFVTLVVDPLNIARRPDNDMGFNRFGITGVIGPAMVSAIVFRLFAVPSVLAGGDLLLIRNPLRQWSVPVSLISDTDDGLTYMRVHVPGRKIICAGLEKSNLSLMRRDQTMDSRLDRAIGQARDPLGRVSRGDASPQVTWNWVAPQRSEIVMVVLWGIYFCVGAIVSI